MIILLIFISAVPLTKIYVCVSSNVKHTYNLNDETQTCRDNFFLQLTTLIVKQNIDFSCHCMTF